MGKTFLKNKCLFVEDYSPSVDYKEGRVVALTPEACYHLKNSGIDYDILEDIYDEKKLKADDDKYFDEQLIWFRDFDSLLKEHIGYCKKYGLELAKSHFYQLKYFIDSVIIQARIFDESISKIRPESIIYVGGRKECGEPDIYNLYNNKRQFFLKLCSLTCRKYKIPLSVKYDCRSHMCRHTESSIKSGIIDILKKLHFKAIYYFFKYNKLAKVFNEKGCAKLNLFVLHAGCLGIDIVVRKFIMSGHKVFFRKGDKIILISDIIQKEILNLANIAADEKNRLGLECIKAYDSMLCGKRLINWINDKCSADVSELIIPYFRHFLKNICTRNIAEIMSLKKFYKDQSIDYILMRSSSEPDSISALCAGQDLKGRVCFQHGIIHDMKIAALTELDLFDYYFAMDGISQQFFKGCMSLDYISECRIFQAPHYLRAISKRWRHGGGASGAIMYAPTRIFTGLNVFNVNYYTITRYFEFQKAIVDLFGRMKDRRFIYKCTPEQEWLSNSILLYIKDRRYKNIYIEKRPLPQCFGMAHKLILDYPTTGFYEAAASGMPVMSLYHDTFRIDNTIKSFFGKSIQKFNTADEAQKLISDFIYAPAADFIAKVPLSEDDAVKILQGIKKE